MVVTIFHADQEREGREFDAASDVQQWFVGSAHTCVVSWSYK
jgi:hypothetical protein